jgi:hypothetical protein
MKFLTSLLAIVLLLCSAVASAAGSASGVTIASTETDSYAHFYVYFSAAVGGSPPSCATVTNAMVVDGSTTTGAVMVAQLLTFYSLGKTITANGAGNCNVSGSGFETLNLVYSSN